MNDQPYPFEPWRARQRVITLGTHTQGEAFRCIKSTLPRIPDASPFFDAVEQRLGDRAVRDPWTTPKERSLLLRDSEHPDWFLRRRLLRGAVGRGGARRGPSELARAVQHRQARRTLSLADGYLWGLGRRREVSRPAEPTRWQSPLSQRVSPDPARLDR